MFLDRIPVWTSYFHRTSHNRKRFRYLQLIPAPRHMPKTSVLEKMSKSQRGCNPTRARNDEFFIFFVGKIFKRIQILLKSKAVIYCYGEFGGVSRTDQSCYEVYDSLFLHGCRSFCLDVRKLLKSRAVDVNSSDKWNQNRTNYKQKAGGSKRHLFAVPHSDAGSPSSSRELRLVYRAWLLSHLRGCEVVENVEECLRVF